MKPKRLAGLATILCGTVFCSVLALFYLQAPQERRLAVNETLFGFKADTTKPAVVRTPPFCFKTFTRRAHRSGMGMVTEQKCIAFGSETDTTRALLARAVLEGFSARSRM